MFNKVSESLANILINNKTIEHTQFDICKYGIQQGLIMLMNGLTIIIIGLFMHEIWYIITFLVLYVPLRNYAGGYHANDSIHCFIYSLIIVYLYLLAVKMANIKPVVCLIIMIFSCISIIILSPVPDLNKPLDNKERAVYKKRTYMVLLIESIICITVLLLKIAMLINCFTWFFLIIDIILIIGKIKNIIILKHKR